MKRFVNSVRNLSDPASFWRLYYRRKQAGHEHDELRVPLRGGLTAIVPSALMGSFDEVFLREVYGGGLRALRGPTPVVIDIGANAGLFSLRVLARHPHARVLAFEPLPRHLAMLERQIVTNPGLGLTVDARAVFGEKTMLEIRFDSRREFSTDASLFPVEGADASVAVEATTLADLYDRYAVSQCHLLKLDCEGAEFDILYKCPDPVFAATDNIVFEIHEKLAGQGSTEDLVGFLRGKGYRVTHRRNGNNGIVTCTR